MRLTVYGVPAPQGSKTRMPNGAMLDGKSPAARAKHKAWRTAVTEAAIERMDGAPPLDGPLMLAVQFRLPMPPSRRKSVQARGIAWHATKPDIDKLLRSTIDGLADGGALRDDSRIAYVSANAYEVVGWTGCELRLDVLDETDLPSSP